MNIYLTGVNVTKNNQRKSSNKVIKSPNNRSIKENKEKLNEEGNKAKEDEISSDQIKISLITSNEVTNKTNQLLNEEKRNTIEINNINNNNFISDEDRNIKAKYNMTEKEFSQMRKIDNIKKKNNQVISNEIKNEYIEYVMLKEPKYADFDKISKEYQSQLYSSYQRYNQNILIIQKKKKELELIVSIIEKSLVNNFFLKDSSMLPVYEKMIEKVKLDIMTKKQEHDGYHKLYEELYNKNFILKRKVLEEVEMDRKNNIFYDQYKILKSHAIVQVSKKQEILNQIEEYRKKMEEDNEKELKSKNRILKDLKLHIEVFKEDEKDLLNKLIKVQKKREETIELIKEKLRRNENIHNNIKYLLIRYHKSFISMNKIFRSVNAKNLDDVLFDVSYTNYRFNSLKIKIVSMNQKINDLNAKYVKLCNQLKQIKKDIAIAEEKSKTTYHREDTDRVEQIRQDLKKLKEEQYKINVMIQKSKGTFQKGIIFLFQRTKMLVNNIKLLTKFISPKLSSMIKKYKNIPFSVDYNNIDKDFIKNFAFIFFKFSHIIFYLFLNSMSYGINTNSSNSNYELKSLFNKDSLKKYEAGIKTSLQTFNRRVELKKEKQKEINAQTIKKDLEKKLKKRKENKSITTEHKMLQRFINYLYNKDGKQNKVRSQNNEYIISKESSKSSNSFFFTGIDLVKNTKASDKDSQKNNSINEITNKFRYKYIKDNENKIKSITFREKQDYIQKNRNKFRIIFNKYQNDLIKENEKNLFITKRNKPSIPRSRSLPRIYNKISYFRNNPLSNKSKQEKEKSTQIKPKLMDEDYDYDEDEEDQDKPTSVPLKKNKTFNNFMNFKLNKDQANIFKKMNDLRRLNIAYFGGNYNSHKESDEQNLLHGSNTAFEKFKNLYLNKQSVDSDLSRSKKRDENLRKKMIEKIKSSKRLSNKSNFLEKIQNRNNSIKNIFNRNKTFDKFKKSDKKINYSLNDKKNNNLSNKNERNFKYQSIEQRKFYSKSINEKIKIKNNNSNNKKIKNKNPIKNIKSSVKGEKN